MAPSRGVTRGKEGNDVRVCFVLTQDRICEDQHYLGRVAAENIPVPHDHLDRRQDGSLVRLVQ